MQVLLLTLLVAGAFAQTIDPQTLIDIFGQPSSTLGTSPPTEGTSPPTQGTTPTPPVTTPGLDSFTVKPTDSSTTFVNKEGVPCQCVPYYLCNHDLQGTLIRNASLTGWGDLDIRFGEEDCQESIERCCTEVKDEKENEIPGPDPALKGCGYRNLKGLDFTVTGGSGNEAQFGEFPWVVALIAENGSYAGVGVLIHPQVVMTGAHIAFKYQPGGLKVRVGEWDTQTVRERLKHQEEVVQDIYIHKDFIRSSLFNDMALLRLTAPVTLGPHVNVICLPNQDEDFDQTKSCVANGWGKDVFGKAGRYAVILKKLEIDMVPHQRCNDLLKRTRLGNNFKLHKSFVCAGGEEGKDTCTGDGGAPLACPIGGDRYKLTGLVAWGIGCGGKDVPAVYASVPAFRNWVDAKMAQWGFETTGYTI